MAMMRLFRAAKSVYTVRLFLSNVSNVSNVSKYA